MNLGLMIIHTWFDREPKYVWLILAVLALTITKFPRPNQ